MGGAERVCRFAGDGDVDASLADWGEVEAEQVGAGCGGGEGDVDGADAADLDAERVGGSGAHPISSWILAAGSGAPTMEEPTRMASAPAARTRRTSSAV